MNKPALLAAALGLGLAGTALAQPAPPPAPPEGPPRPGAEGPGPMRGWHRGPPPSRGASFHVERGESSVHIRCAEGEPMRACVDAAGVLLDKLATMPAR